MPHLEYFRSFVNLEDFIPEGCSLKKKKQTSPSLLTYSQRDHPLERVTGGFDTF